MVNMPPENLPPSSGAAPHIAVVGAGLAGLAAAAALVDGGARVTVLEARRRVGGRAASFDDPSSGGLVDACQHVAMGCCTNFLDLAGRAGFAPSLRHDRTLWFIGPEGDRSRCTPWSGLPAPLHLAPLLFGMRHFSWWERARLGLGMLRLARTRGAALDDTAAAWLRRIGQPERVVRLFWQPVLESALGESIDLVSVSAARKVAVDGFLAHPTAADLHVPVEPLGVLFGERLLDWLRGRGVRIETGMPVQSIERQGGRVSGVRRADGIVPCDGVVVAVPWRAAARLVPDLVPEAEERLAGSPITAVHLWFDRQPIDLPHAVLVGRVSQWVFRAEADPDAPGAGYCQVVISASRGLLGGDREKLVATVVEELRDVFPGAASATLLASRVVTDPTAVLSVRPGVDAVRPPAATAIGNLTLAGDWTATGWPSTMEGAVRSGRLAAAALLPVVSPKALPQRCPLTPDLPRGLLARLLFGA
jgi:squalene-associated FAD-dependent desaturase